MDRARLSPSSRHQRTRLNRDVNTHPTPFAKPQGRATRLQFFCTQLFLYANGVKFHSPGSLAQLAHPGNGPICERTPTGFNSRSASIPHVSLVDFDTVDPAEPPKLILIGFLAVVLLLIRNVPRQGVNMAGADGENSVTCLPPEIGQVRALLLDPFRGFFFEIADKIGNGNIPAESTKNVNVIFDAASLHGMTIEIPADPHKISMQGVAQRSIFEKGGAVLRGEYEMQLDFRERLRHVRARIRVQPRWGWQVNGSATQGALAARATLGCGI